MSCALFVAAHADDVVIGATSALIGFPGRKILLSITDDRRLGDVDAPAIQSDLHDTLRRHFNLEATESLMLSEGATGNSTARIAAAIGSAMKRHSVTDVYVPAFQGGHVDHDSVALAARRLLPSSGPLFHEYALYFKHGGEHVHNQFLDAPSATTRLTEADLAVRNSALSDLSAYLVDSRYFIGDQHEGIRPLTDPSTPALDLEDPTTIGSSYFTSISSEVER